MSKIINTEKYLRELECETALWGYNEDNQYSFGMSYKCYLYALNGLGNGKEYLNFCLTNEVNKMV